MYCQKCNSELTTEDTICPQCKAFISEPNENSETNTIATTQNTSESIKKWNWGAFAVPVFWGIGNYNYLPLLSLIPIFGIAWRFVCGIKGNEWAYASGKFKSVEDFLAIQQTWNRAGIALFIVQIIGFLYFLFNLMTVLALMGSYFY
jgi:hypothetical protein